jgi:hypothetical protein
MKGVFALRAYQPRACRAAAWRSVGRRNRRQDVSRRAHPVRAGTLVEFVDTCVDKAACVGATRIGVACPRSVRLLASRRRARNLPGQGPFALVYRLIER